MYNKKINKESLRLTHRIQKKGISAIVATVLIILITVAASTILWVSVNSFVGDKLDEGTVCLDSVKGLQLSDSGYSCVGATELNLQIKHGPEAFALEEIQVLIYDNTGTVTSKKITTGFPGPNEEKVFKVVHGLTPANIMRVEIAPVIPFGDTKKICDISGSVAIEPCLV